MSLDQCFLEDWSHDRGKPSAPEEALWRVFFAGEPGSQGRQPELLAQARSTQKPGLDVWQKNRARLSIVTPEA